MRQTFQTFRFSFLGLCCLSIFIIIAGCSDSFAPASMIEGTDRTASTVGMEDGDTPAGSPELFYFSDRHKIKSCDIANCNATTSDVVDLKNPNISLALTHTATHLYWISADLKSEAQNASSDLIFAGEPSYSKIQSCQVADCAGTLSDVLQMGSLGLFHNMDIGTAPPADCISCSYMKDHGVSSNIELTVTSTHLMMEQQFWRFETNPDGSHKYTLTKTRTICQIDNCAETFE